MQYKYSARSNVVVGIVIVDSVETLIQSLHENPSLPSHIPFVTPRKQFGSVFSTYAPATSSIFRIKKNKNIKTQTKSNASPFLWTFLSSIIDSNIFWYFVG